MSETYRYWHPPVYGATMSLADWGKLQLEIVQRVEQLAIVTIERDTLSARVAELEAERDRIAADAAAFQAEADDWRRMAGRLREALRILDGFVEPAPTSSQWRAICAKAAELKEALR